ncbi:MAG: helix-turn-helix transcriptional regulator [Pseudomonadota bacterium]
MIEEEENESVLVNKKCGARIRAIRNSKGMSAEALSALSGVSEGYITKVERGEKSPTLSILSRLANALDVHIVTFFTFE